MEHLLGMTFASYCYGGSKPSDDKDEHHINRVVFDGEDKDDRDDRDAKLVQLVNQYMIPPTPKFEVVNADDQYRYNDWANTFSFVYMP